MGIIFQDISSGKYIQLVNEARAMEAKQKGANIDEEAGGKGGKVNTSSKIGIFFEIFKKL